MTSTGPIRSTVSRAVAKSAKKQPRTTLRSSAIDRQPKTLSRRTDDHGHSKPLFSFHHADDKGSTPCAFAPQSEEAKGLIEFICEMSKLTWREIRVQTADGHKRHHSQPVDKISRVARARLAARHLDEIIPDDLFRFRVSGKKRLWGFVSDDVFHALWWDPDHNVYPTEPMNT